MAAATATASRTEPRTALGRGPRTGRLVSCLTPAAVSLALGLWGITREGTMWRDESVTYQVSHRSLSETAALLQHADAVHGLYYLFMHGLFAVWEGGLVTMRLPSVLATALTAGLVAVTALRLTARPVAGLLSGLAFAVTPEVQMYAQEGRSYAMVCALVAVATYLFVTLMQSTSKARWFCYALAVLTASLLHEFAALTLLAHGITLYRSRPPARIRRHFAVSATGVLIGLLPLAVLSMSQSGQVSWIGGPEPREWFEIAGVALAASACAAYLSRPGRHADVTGPAFPLAIVPTATLLLAAVHEPMYVDRYVLYTNIGWALLVGTTVACLTDDARKTALLQNRKVRILCAVGVVAAFVTAMLPVTLQMRTPDSRKDDVTAISKEVERLSEAGDAVLFAPARRREWMLSYPHQFKGLTDVALKDGPSTSGTLQGVELPPGDIRERLAHADGIIVLSDPEGQPLDSNAGEAVKREVLERDFAECQRVELKGGQVTLYARSACPPVLPDAMPDLGNTPSPAATD
ncbi:glycosyltransferase family 39 protein [Streptomyces sp. ISL-10]|nr:glycosyltransferase family 39 protein [Streptomyces sp. ISL-10]